MLAAATVLFVYIIICFCFCFSFLLLFILFGFIYYTAYYNYLFCNRAEALPVSLAAITASASLLQFRMEMRLPCTEIVEINALGDEKPIVSFKLFNFRPFEEASTRNKS